MSSFSLTALAALLLCAVAVSGENCQAAQQQAEEQCGGLGCRQVLCEGDSDDFSPTQCEGSMCKCVDKNGSQISNYAFHISIYGDCQCARDELEGVNQVDCMPNGSYHPLAGVA